MGLARISKARMIERMNRRVTISSMPIMISSPNTHVCLRRWQAVSIRQFTTQVKDTVQARTPAPGTLLCRGDTFLLARAPKARIVCLVPADRTGGRPGGEKDVVFS